jgi:hypothetical protein
VEEVAVSFEIRQETRQRMDKDVLVTYPVSVVYFEDVALAICSDPEQRQQTAEQYIRTHGYLGRWSKAWMIGQPINWSDDLRVEA